MGGRKPRPALVVEREPRVQDRTTDPGGVMIRAASVGLCAGTSNRIRPISRVVDLGARAVCWRGEVRRTHRLFMGRIVTSVIVENVPATGAVRIDALVDTGAGYLTLPMAWKERFGAFALEEEVALQTATQQVVSGTVCGPALVRIEGFRPIHGEVLFVEMEPEEGEYEPLLGYIPLEQCGAAVDLVGHRLLPVRYIDAKTAH